MVLCHPYDSANLLLLSCLKFTSWFQCTTVSIQWSCLYLFNLYLYIIYTRLVLLPELQLKLFMQSTPNYPSLDPLCWCNMLKLTAVRRHTQVQTVQVVDQGMKFKGAWCKILLWLVRCNSLVPRTHDSQPYILVFLCCVACSIWYLNTQEVSANTSHMM